MRDLSRRPQWFALAALGLAAAPAAQDAPPAPPLAAPGGAVLDDVPLPADAQGFDDFLEPAPPAGGVVPGPAGTAGAPDAAPGSGAGGGAVAQTDDSTAETSAASPYAGSLGAGLAEVRALADAGDLDGALELTERLLAPDAAGRLRAWLEARSDGLSERALGLVEGPLERPLAALGYDPLAPEQRAEVHYARGVTLRAAGRDGDALEAYERAVGLGGAARADAVYELGHVELVRGEDWRSEIPELNGGGAAPALPPVPPAPGAGRGGDAEEDPLEEARRAYESALAHFTERLRIDWRDADTRANVELVRRRLDELDAVERQREEQQQEPQEGDPSSSPDGERSDEPPPEDGEPQDAQEPGEEEPEPQPEEGPEEEPEPAPEEAEDPSGEERPEPEPREVNLTDEEMERLLGRLREHQERGEEVQAALNARRRRGAARDW